MIYHDDMFAFGWVIWERGSDRVVAIDSQTMRGIVFMATHCGRKIPAVGFVRDRFKLSLPSAKQMVEDFVDYFNERGGVLRE